MSARGVTISSVQPNHDHARLAVRGALDRDGIAVLHQRLHGVIGGGARYVVVDISEVDSCDPSVLGDLTAAVRRLSVRQGWLRLVGIQPAVAAALDTANLPDHFTMYMATEAVA